MDDPSGLSARTKAIKQEVSLYDDDFVLGRRSHGNVSHLDKWSFFLFLFEATPTIKQDILSSALLCTCQQVRDPFLSSLLKGGVLRLNAKHSNLFFFWRQSFKFFPKKSERGHLLSSSILPLGKNMRVSPIESLSSPPDVRIVRTIHHDSGLERVSDESTSRLLVGAYPSRRIPLINDILCVAVTQSGKRGECGS